MIDSNLVDPKAYAFNEKRLSVAIEYAITHESKMDRDIATALAKGHFEEPADLGQIVGPVKPRKAGSGAILRSGKLVRFWGDVDYVDMSFSISKSFLSLCTGLAVKNGIISDVNEPVRNSIENVGFMSCQNKDITWAQMLQLTSEWEGTLWGKSDRIDHNRDLSDDVRSKFKKVRNENSKSRERIGNIMTSELTIYH